jgi:hypothetical protein
MTLHGGNYLLNKAVVVWLAANSRTWELRCTTGELEIGGAVNQVFAQD